LAEHVVYEYEKIEYMLGVIVYLCLHDRAKDENLRVSSDTPEAKKLFASGNTSDYYASAHI